MWKLISLSALLIVAQAADVKDFNGDWFQVAYYPVSTNIPVCLRYTFKTKLSDVPCVYADGTIASLLQVSAVTDGAGHVAEGVRFAMQVVDTAAEVMPALNLTCIYGDKPLRAQGVARLFNDNYFVFYHKIVKPMESNSTEVEENAAYLFAKEVESKQAILDVMSSIEDLKDRQGAVKCSKENYSGFVNGVGN